MKIQFPEFFQILFISILNYLSLKLNSDCDEEKFPFYSFDNIWGSKDQRNEVWTTVNVIADWEMKIRVITLVFMEWRLRGNQKKIKWERKCILLSLRAGVGSYIHSPLAWLVLTMIVRKQKLLWNCYEGLRKNTTLTIMHKNILKKIPGGRLNLFCLRQVVDD